MHGIKQVVEHNISINGLVFAVGIRGRSLGRQDSKFKPMGIIKSNHINLTNCPRDMSVVFNGGHWPNNV